MPPRGPKPPEHRHGERRHHPPGPPHHARDRTLDRFVDRDRIDRLLTPWIPADDDRAFVVRCLLDEGPAHHRGANFILLSLLGEALPSPVANVRDAAGDADHARIRLRLPPHLRHPSDDEDAYPVRLPLAPLRRLAGNDERAVEAMVDCLTDGPPQHALANAAMILLLDAVLCR